MPCLLLFIWPHAWLDPLAIARWFVTWRLIPPSIDTICPVTHVTLGSVNATIQRATSSQLAMRPRGTCFTNSAFTVGTASLGKPIFSKPAVSVGPGAIVFTRTLAGGELESPGACHRPLENGCLGRAVNGATGDGLVPGRAADVEYTAPAGPECGERGLRCERDSVDIRLELRAHRVLRRLPSSGANLKMPALFTRTSSRPASRTMLSTAARTSPYLESSARTHLISGCFRRPDSGGSSTKVSRSSQEVRRRALGKGKVSAGRRHKLIRPPSRSSRTPDMPRSSARKSRNAEVDEAFTYHVTACSARSVATLAAGSREAARGAAG